MGDKATLLIVAHYNISGDYRQSYVSISREMTSVYNKGKWLQAISSDRKETKTLLRVKRKKFIFTRNKLFLNSDYSII